ncbi:Histone-lysine N-methyltransferase SETMAR [Eumeta japonica]|uniref:Histone-lysine N-methyltransferase SETMAR n=1 Tax=Eumeta variegata TaxID=151549 RepID=A0A4C1WIM4_EUMVA|nr:Histone-lysine N-methyltransferase SETMAR [Eumeta japonica]
MSFNRQVKLSNRTADEIQARRREKRLYLSNRKDMVLHHNNPRRHISLATQQIMREFGLEVLMHPPYNLNLTTLDFHLFRSLQNSLVLVQPAIVLAHRCPERVLIGLNAIQSVVACHGYCAIWDLRTI